MCEYYLIEPVACTPASGWEKRQVAAGPRAFGLVNTGCRHVSLKDRNGLEEFANGFYGVTKA